MYALLLLLLLNNEIPSQSLYFPHKTWLAIHIGIYIYIYMEASSLPIIFYNTRNLYEHYQWSRSLGATLMAEI
jgi:hypothetical protein